MLMFVRFAALVKDRGGRVVLECPAMLLALLRTCPGIDQLVAEGEPLPEYDVQAPLMSLPGLLGVSLTTVPASTPYLRAEPLRVQAWQARLAAIPGFRVGVVWQGNPHFDWDRFRSFPLGCLEPLARVVGVSLVSLQRVHGTEQIRTLAGRFRIEDLGPGLDPEGGAFLDTAAVLQHLDLVVSPDTAVAHLAGGLGVPVWLALAQVSDWRWLRQREDTPWYPSMPPVCSA